MQKLAYLFVLIFLMAVSVAAQDLAKNDDKKAAPKVEEKAKAPAPVVLSKDKLLELDNLRLSLENAQLRADASIPQALKDKIKEANDAIGKFWQAVGIKPEELQTKWEASQGVDNSIILRWKEEKVESKK